MASFVSWSYWSGRSFLGNNMCAICRSCYPTLAIGCCWGRNGLHHSQYFSWRFCWGSCLSGHSFIFHIFISSVSASTTRQTLLFCLMVLVWIVFSSEFKSDFDKNGLITDHICIWFLSWFLLFFVSVFFFSFYCNTIIIDINCFFHEFSSSLKRRKHPIRTHFQQLPIYVSSFYRGTYCEIMTLLRFVFI